MTFLLAGACTTMIIRGVIIIMLAGAGAGIIYVMLDLGHENHAYVAIIYCFTVPPQQ